MEKYEKTGYLEHDFKMFHLIQAEKKEFEYHYHDFDKIMILIKGDVTYHIEGRSYSLKPFDIVFVNAGEVHKPVIEKSTVYERIIIYISPDYLASFKEKEGNLAECFRHAKANNSHILRIDFFQKSNVYDALMRLERALTEDGFANALYERLLFLEFMIELNRAAIDKHVNYIETNTSNGKMIELIDYIMEHLTEELTIDMLAKEFFMSKYYLMHSFKDETGYTIGNYISTKRLLLARNLIEDGMSVTNACYACGYQNYSTFSRAYKKQFHTSAKEHGRKPIFCGNIQGSKD